MWNVIKDIGQNGVNKEVLSRGLLVAIVIMVAWSVFEYVLENMGFIGVGITAVGLSVTSSCPRWFILWYERRSFLIELTFSGLLWWLSGGVGGFGIVSFLIGSAGVVSIMKLINENRFDTEGQSFVQLFMTVKAWRIWRFFGRAEGPLDPEWRWDKDVDTGFMDWRFFIGHFMNRKDKDYDFFESVDLPSKPPIWIKWVNKRRYWELLDNYERKIKVINEYERMLNQTIQYEKELEELMANPPTTNRKEWLHQMQVLQVKIETNMRHLTTIKKEDS